MICFLVRWRRILNGQKGPSHGALARPSCSSIRRSLLYYLERGSVFRWQVSLLLGRIVLTALLLGPIYLTSPHWS
jgi:hypothetical protein